LKIPEIPIKNHPVYPEKQNKNLSTITSLWRFDYTPNCLEMNSINYVYIITNAGSSLHAQFSLIQGFYETLEQAQSVYISLISTDEKIEYSIVKIPVGVLKHIEKEKSSCKFCRKKFSDTRSRGSHQSRCPKNPIPYKRKVDSAFASASASSSVSSSASSSSSSSSYQVIDDDDDDDDIPHSRLF